MDVYLLGEVTWNLSQGYYHALAHLNRQGLVLCWPDQPYLCLGRHDDWRELDWEACRRMGLPVLRREVGGGTVYLDVHQVFFQLVLSRDHVLATMNLVRLWGRVLEPVRRVYRQVGITVEHVPPADLQVGGRKVSGCGGGQVGWCTVLVGNILLDFHCRPLVDVLSLSDPSLRAAVAAAMGERVTSVGRETGRSVAPGEVMRLLEREFAVLLGPLTPRVPDAALEQAARYRAGLLGEGPWLRQSGIWPARRRVKICEGVWVEKQPEGEIST